jgi:predicted AAA+ superfamily ATPase
MIPRQVTHLIQGKLGTKKAIILLGPRQVGKTTLLKELVHSNNWNVLWINGDDFDVNQMLANLNAEKWKSLIGKNSVVIVDEAQRIHDIGLKLKILTDQLSDIQVIVSGSSSLEIAQKVNEPLTGRKWEYQMFPLCFQEMVNYHGLITEKRLIPKRLIFGYYPDVVNHPDDSIETLKQLASSYLYKDFLSLDQVRNSDLVVNLLRALAFQIGSQVSYHELSQMLGVDTKTIEKYINLLEQSFVIFRLGSFSQNLRNELKKSKKIYFFDVGMRNAIINNFLPLESRNDSGVLWENFIIMERIKFLHYHRRHVNQWFWRTKEQKEIDLIEEENGELRAFEFKNSGVSTGKIPGLFLKSYPNSKTEIITPENIEEFILPGKW